MNSVPLRRITAQYGTSSSALQRHKPHVLKQYARALKAIGDGEKLTTPPDALQIQDSAKSAVGEVLDLKRRALAALDKAEAAGLEASALGWFRELRSCIELLCKVRIVEAQHAREFPCETGNLERSPEWTNLRTRMLTSLLPYPDARAALLASMRA